MLSTLLVAASLLGANGVIGKDIKIGSAKEFISFVNNVNDKGKTYKGTTVLLESDIAFSAKYSEQFKPIGINADYCFRGTFDGQGYAIKNLKVNISTKDNLVGLFGYTTGLTVRNVVIDRSCSFEQSYKVDFNGDFYLGGLISYFYAYYGPSTIENNVNMASVTYSGYLRQYIGSNVYVGGLAGHIYSHNYNITFKNCANYGLVRHIGTCYDSYIGGLVANSLGRYSAGISFKNCLNYETVFYRGSSKNLYMGGIAGKTTLSNIENCVNAGDILTIAKSGYIGSVVGYLHTSSLLNSYDNGENSLKSCGFVESSGVEESLNFKMDGVGSNGNSIVDTLNAYVDSHRKESLSHWAFNNGGKTVTFTVNGEKRFALTARIMILPDLAKEGKTLFYGWYTDSGCTTLLKNYEITVPIGLYGIFGGNKTNEI